MGCASSREMEEEPPPVRAAPDSERSNASAPPRRLSISYSAQELGSPRQGSRAELLVERKAAIKLGSMADTLGSHTRHGVVPGPSGSAYAKINQDRGAVFWPFNDSHNEALLCVFDGHGVAGEKVAEVCIKKIPPMLQERGVELRADPMTVLTTTVLDTEEDVRCAGLAAGAGLAGRGSCPARPRDGSAPSPRLPAPVAKPIPHSHTRTHVQPVPPARRRDIAAPLIPPSRHPPSAAHPSRLPPQVMTRNNGRFARTCGCTSIIVYLHGTSLWSACSGDSRAVMGSSFHGEIVAHDLSEDCKPDTPSETARILAAGGTVSAAIGARPSRVWANGKIGLAMSRSIGDGECKKYGVIADPDVKHFTLEPAAEARDGDKFLIVASDGVWEFITSQEACEIVAAVPGSASRASAALVQEAAQRWKDIEGNYRDDITAIVAYLPFTHAEHPPASLDMVGKASSRPSLDATLVDNSIYINMGEKGISPLTEDASPFKRPARTSAARAEQFMDKPADGTAAGAFRRPGCEASSFANRRLSVSTPVCDIALSDSFDEDDWDRNNDTCA
eukprot:scaffold8586_cov108-Isochrysis_galbana.AAC.2